MTTRRILSLDGLRALSIGLVLFEHATAYKPKLTVDGRTLLRFEAGHFGVRVFFVISGYLISSILFAELERTGTISLARFYFRRTFRIFPAYYVYVSTVAALAYLGALRLEPGDLLTAVTYTANYHVGGWELTHAWSLAVEEQFYLVWPALLVALGRRRGLGVAAVVVALSPLVRFVQTRYVGSSPDLLDRMAHTIADAMATGCLLAGFRDVLHASARYRAFQRSAWFVLVPIGALVAGSLGPRPTVDMLVGSTMRHVLIALVIDWCITHPGGLVGKVLNARPLVFVGTLSYSLYLWQQLFLHRDASGWQHRLPVAFVLAFIAAVVSYELIEKPFLRLRDRLEARGRARRS